MDNVSIRKFSTDDISLVLDLLYDLGRPKPESDSDVEMFERLITVYSEDSDKTILVAEIDDVGIVGMVSVVFLSRLNRLALEMYVPELIVLEKYQNHGIGKN